MWNRRPALLLALALGACGGEPAPTDAGPDAAARDAGALADAGPGDAGETCRSGETQTLIELGHCFEARTCCIAADCGGERSWRCNEAGLCEEEGRPCGCVDDLDCAGGEFCITNAVVCGVCVPTRDPCVADASCDSGETCVDGYCVDGASCTEYPAP